MSEPQVTDVFNETNVIFILDLVTNGVWPDGQFKKGRPPVNPAESLKMEFDTREDAIEQMRLLGDTLVENHPSFVSLLGDESVRNGLLKLFSFFQLEPVVKHIGYSVLDSLFTALFPELELIITHMQSDIPQTPSTAATDPLGAAPTPSSDENNKYSRMFDTLDEAGLSSAPSTAKRSSGWLSSFGLGSFSLFSSNSDRAASDDADASLSASASASAGSSTPAAGVRTYRTESTTRRDLIYSHARMHRF
jgi:hypothetical protein